MKTSNRALNYIAIFASILSIVAAFTTLDLKKLFSVDWGILGWVTLAVGLFAVFSFFMTTYLMMQRHRILNVYLSCPISNKEEIEKLKDALDGENVMSIDTLEPGSNISGLKKMIKQSSFCFFAVGKFHSLIQDQELKVMKSMGKKIYLVSMDEHGKIPRQLHGEVPLYINDENFKSKIEDILMSYK